MNIPPGTPTDDIGGIVIALIALSFFTVAVWLWHKWEPEAREIERRARLTEEDIIDRAARACKFSPAQTERR